MTQPITIFLGNLKATQDWNLCKKILDSEKLKSNANHVTNDTIYVYILGKVKSDTKFKC